MSSPVIDGAGRRYLEEFLEAHRRREGLAQATSGELAVGYVGSDVPPELIIAAGCRPVRITGDPDGPLDLADSYLEPMIDGLARSQFNRLLDGTFAGIDHVILSRDCEGSARVFHTLRSLRLAEPERRLPDVHFFDLLHQPFRTSLHYSGHCIQELCERLAAWSGRETTAESLADAVRTLNHRRAAVRALARVRRSEPPRMRGVEALAIMAGALSIPGDDFEHRLAAVLDHIADREPLMGPRLLVAGSGQDNSKCHETIEGLGAVVVADDHDWGDRIFSRDVQESTSHLELAIAARYRQVAGSARTPIAIRARATVDLAVAASVDGVVILLRDGDDAPWWDVPEQRRVLRERQIPSVVVEVGAYHATDVDGIRHAVEPFVAELRKAAA